MCNIKCDQPHLIILVVKIGTQKIMNEFKIIFYNV